MRAIFLWKKTQFLYSPKPKSKAINIKMMVMKRRCTEICLLCSKLLTDQDEMDALA